MRRQATYGIAIVAATIVGVWLYLTPHIAVRNMKKAAAANDSAALSSYIDFSSLKENLKAHFNATLATDFVKSTSNNPFEALGMAMATAIINPMIDSLVTPESLAMMMQGNKPIPKGMSTKQESSHVATAAETTMGYEDFDKFVVSVRSKEEAEDSIGFVFHRQNLVTWKLASLRLPPVKTSSRQSTSVPKIQQTIEPSQTSAKEEKGEVFINGRGQVLVSGDPDKRLLQCVQDGVDKEKKYDDGWDDRILQSCEKSSRK